MAMYPVFVHEIEAGETNVAVSGEIPDFPGCFVASDDWERFPSAVQEAVELYFEGEDLSVPHPTSIDQLRARTEFKQGAWVLVDIDTNRI